MELSLDNSTLLPPVEMLVARVLGESADGSGGNKSRLKATFAKYTVSDQD
jgi:hypothetical protein